MRTKQKRFTFPWGGGVVAEEVQVSSEYIRPTIQLLRYDDRAMGDSIRFCVYNHDGSFSRMPLLVGAADLRALGKALGNAPKLRRLLKHLSP